MQLSKQQSSALQAATRWFLHDTGSSPMFRIFGYAGTGKSTIANLFASEIGGKVLYGAYTGKAALVMRKKGCEGASTLHSLIYDPYEDDDGKVSFALKPKHESDLDGAKLLIVDECSMVGPDLGRDLMSFGVPVLVLGDPGQLPPINGQGFFDTPSPEAMLTEVHRQAKDNPIIRMSMDVREGKPLKVGKYGTSRVIRLGELDLHSAMAADQLLVGTNATRREWIADIREVRGFGGALPSEGERLICLRNDRKRGLLNGGQWQVKRSVAKPPKTARAVAAKVAEMRLRSLDTDAEQDVLVPGEWFTGRDSALDNWEKARMQQFDYAYAITVHKAQGSQFDHVVVIDQSAVFRENASRHLYTAITRAAESVTVAR